MDINQTSSRQPKRAIADISEFLGISMQAVHKQLKNKNIICEKIGNKSFLTYESAKELFNFKFKRKKIAVQIVKGGTGKTTTINNIASCANTYGAKVLLIDADPQGNVTDANGIDAENYPVLIDILKGVATVEDAIISVAPGFDLISSRIENVILDNEIVNGRYPLEKLYKNLLKNIENNYDFIFIDCPPTMGQAVTAASLYADTILAPLNPDKFSAKGLKILKQEIETLNKHFSKKIEYRVFLNKFSAKTILSDKAIMSLISDPELEGKVLSTTVQYAQEIPNITDDNKSSFSNLKKSLVRDDFDRLTRELLDINAESFSKEERSQTIYASEESVV
ncbi:ParA family protein [Legionella sp. km772]|uniref:ParA family protein n=1 Tax=Legionella sp. km772 TaxID=2498111 RepID=UPI000F8C5FA6|nr:ParA family protein [Legionella sp. km772]RUR14114.1 ParA family protein [Legionella sp. km772]